MSFDGATVRQRLDGATAGVGILERALWILVALSLVGDLATTAAGLHLGLTESNPVARGAIDGLGLVGMLGLKAFALAIAVYCRTLLPEEYAPIVPAGLAVPWTAAVVVNLYVISLAI